MWYLLLFGALIIVSLIVYWRDKIFIPKEDGHGCLSIKRKYDDHRYLYKIGGGWGNAINWTYHGDLKNGKVVGWKSRIPREGDILTTNMQSGKIGVYEFVNVDRCGDPHDMFFADVNWVGYSDSPHISDMLKEIKTA